MDLDDRFSVLDSLLFRPNLMGDELYTQMVFFVQTILADRYNHRSELLVVSVESPPSVENEIKKVFFQIFLFIGSYRCIKFWEYWT